MYKQSNIRRWLAGIGNAFLILVMLVSAMGLQATPVLAAPAGTALQFNGTSQYVTFGNTRLIPGTLTNSPTWNTQTNSRLGRSSLLLNGTNQYVTTGIGTTFNSASFTVETWFYRTAAGVGVTTGGSGIASAIPLLTKGTSEGETSTADINYFLGIDATTAKLVADFEEGAGGGSPSLNHPITGTTTIALNTWYHAAATYDGNKWQLFLNGNLEGELVIDRPANAAVISPLALGTSIMSNGTTTQGFFAGRLDEARVWNYPRTQADIQASMNSEILTPTTGLIGRWGLNDASGSTASNLNRLGLTSFTLEAWVKRDTGGATMSTGTNGFDGTGGRPFIYPVLTKGMGEGESPANLNTNYFLGITANGFVGADFEDTAGGGNRPAWGTTPIPVGEWHHIA
ncbi:MAG TPA: LamG domain-containing protein, partial [Anaerolineales bacterium]|nr:LamG domain-containing protein [Anaerolineales bacterium]